MTNVWITRTQPAADKTAQAVRDMGFVPVVAPVLRVVPAKIMPPPPRKDAVLVFTSGNGVRAYCGLTEHRNWPVVTVGDATAELARAVGFTQVNSASGASEDVTRLIKTKYKTDRPIVHCAGQIVRGTIAEDLHAAGYVAERHIYYRTEPTGRIPELGGINYVLLHSPLAAQTLRNLKPESSHITAICMSEAVRVALGTLALREIRVANAPTQTALLACLPH